MPKPIIFELTHVEQTDLPLLARVKHDGADITIAAISSIAYVAKNKAGTTTSSGTLTVASVVFNSLQTHARWNLDAAGYNLRCTIPAACWPSPGPHLLELVFTPVSGAPFPLLARVYVMNRWAV